MTAAGEGTAGAELQPSAATINFFGDNYLASYVQYDKWTCYIDVSCLMQHLHALEAFAR